MAPFTAHFRLTLGHFGPGMARQLEQRFVIGPRGGRFGHPTAHLERVTLRRQIQRRIQRMQTLVTPRPGAHPLDIHRAEGRLQAPFVHAPLRALDTVGPCDRAGRLPRAALVEVPLQELAYQLLTTPVQLPCCRSCKSDGYDQLVILRGMTSVAL